MRWRRLGLGFLLGITSGVILGYAWGGREPRLWAIGALVLVLGGLFILLDFLRRHQLLGSVSGVSSEGPAASRLGALLVRYHLITEAALERALSLQGKTGRRLGKVLVEMGLITNAQLVDVLEEQLARREGRFGRRERES